MSTINDKIAERKAALKKVDASKLHFSKNEELKSLAEVLDIPYDPDNFNRGEVTAKIREAMSEVQAEGRVRRLSFTIRRRNCI
jgi:hypothetical protein